MCLNPIQTNPTASLVIHTLTESQSDEPDPSSATMEATSPQDRYPATNATRTDKRKAHKKSRRGCYNCKKRKIKVCI